MRLTCLIFLAVMSVVAVTECKPLGNDVEKTPCVTQPCQKETLRKKRHVQVLFTQAVQHVKFNLRCLSCIQRRYVFTYQMPVNRGPDIYIGNGQNNVNHVVVNGANNIYIGNGAHNTNYVSYG